MKVLFVTGGNNPHFRVAPFVMSQAESLKKEGVNLNIFTIQERGLHGYLRHIGPLRREIRQGDYDLVHAHYAFCGWLVRMASLRIPLVVSLMGSDTYGSVDARGSKKWKSGFITLQSKLLNFAADAIIVKSTNLLKHVLIKRKASVIPNGVDFEKFKPISMGVARARLGVPEEVGCVLFLGNPEDSRKNIGLAKAAVSLLQNAMPIKLYAPWPVHPEEVPFWMNAADLLLVTSYLEGSSNVIKEAMACNCPVISTPSGDALQMLEGVSQCFVCGWDPREIAGSIAEVLENDARSDGRIKRENLNASTVAGQVIEIYRKVLKKDKP